jgi:fumarate hydratase subunit alpha
MREVSVDQVRDTVERLCIEANYWLGEDVCKALDVSINQEESLVGKEILHRILENAALAKQEKIPLCQDTGQAVVFVEIGQQVQVTQGSLTEAINEGVRRGYQKGYLRKSMVRGLFERSNTKDNTPAIIHYDIVPGDKMRIVVAPKGGGSENMSAIQMLKPSDGIAGIKGFIVEVLEQAGANSCPPVVVGVGIGGTMEKAALLAKQALLRPLGQRNPDPEVAVLEVELLTRINDLGIGPQGLGGRITALAVHIETFPTHIACLPVAVNLNCHCTRHKEAFL